MEKHIPVVAWLQIVMGVIGIIVAAFMFLIIAGAGMISGDETAIAILAIVAWFLGALISVLSLPGIIGGIYLLKRKEWARILLIVVSLLDLLNFPFGTALGIYTLWVLMKDETVLLLRS